MKGKFISNNTCKGVAMVLLKTIISTHLSEDLYGHIRDSDFEQVLIVDKIRHCMMVCSPGILDFLRLSCVHAVILADI
jgi:hypothetical protein